MKIGFKLLLFAVIVLLLPAVSGAQTPTPYLAPQFSATFNGPVTAVPAARDTTSDDSTDLSYGSKANGVWDIVNVRTLDDAALTTADYSSSDFYAKQFIALGTQQDSSHSQYQGYPCSYAKVLVTLANGTTRVRRANFIVINSKTVIFVWMLAKPANDSDAAWQAFSNSLVIK